MEGFLHVKSDFLGKHTQLLVKFNKMQMKDCNICQKYIFHWTNIKSSDKYKLTIKLKLLIKC